MRTVNDEALVLPDPPPPKTQPPAFPIDVFPPPLSDYATAVALTMPCALDFIGTGMLAVFGQGIGAKRKIAIKPGWTESPSIFAGLVARPGEGKSPAISRVLEPVVTAEAQARQEYGEALEKWEAAQGDDDFNEPHPVMWRHLVSDITMERLAQVMNDNPPGSGLLLHRDELAGWVLSMNQYRGGRGADRQSWVSIWSGEPWIIDRKTTDDAYVSAPFACVLGGIQPDVLPELATNRDDGFVDRLLFTYPEPAAQSFTTSGVELSLTLAYHGAYRTLLFADFPAASVELTAAAADMFGRWYNDWSVWLNAYDWADGRGARAKMPRYLARFALILSQLRGADVVTEHDIHGGARLVYYFTMMADRALGRITAPPRNVRAGGREREKVRLAILRKLANNAGKRTQRDLCRDKPAGVTKCDEIAHVIGDLIGAGLVKVTRVEKPGGEDRTSVVVTLTTEGWTEAQIA